MGHFWKNTRPRAYLMVALASAYTIIFIVLTLIYMGHISSLQKAEIPIAMCKHVWGNDTSSQPAEMDDNRLSRALGCQLRPVTLMANYTKPHLMTVCEIGRTGNQLFQYAMLLSTARRYGYTPAVPPSFKLAEFFDVPVLKSIKMTNVEVFDENSSFGNYNPRHSELNTNYNWSLKGYFESWKYHDYFMKSDIKFKPHILRAATNFMRAKRREEISNVCIHVRRTDFALKLREGFSMAGKDFIERAMDYFRTNVTRNLQFIVLSDDMRWCKANVAGSDVIYSTFTSPGMDMALMALCDHVIMTAGTFGWWGGRLCPGEVVYWKGYPAPNSPLSRRLIPADYYRPQWKGMW